MATVNLEHVLTVVPQVLQLHQKNIWLSYDEEADVLYLISKTKSRGRLWCWITMSSFVTVKKLWG